MKTTLSKGIVEVPKGDKLARIDLLEKYKIQNPVKFASKGFEAELKALKGKEPKVEEPQVEKPKKADK